MPASAAKPSMTTDPGPVPSARGSLVLAAVLALFFAGLPYVLFGDFDLNLLDEGYLWYGVQRVLAGEVPLREFQAYDPGRYLWCAAFTPLFGSGLLGVRASLALFQAGGLFLGALACRRGVRGSLGLALATAILAAWMFPRHKLFEPALALAALYVAVRMIEAPTQRMHLVAGAFTGLLAFFGRNHALYAAVSLGALGGYLAWKLRPPRLARLALCFAAGVVLGSAPLWGMFLFVPGFAAAYLDSLRLNLLYGANLGLPYPWPWTVAWGNLAGLELFWTSALAAAFLLPFVVLPLGAFVALTSARADLPRRSLVLAATFVGAAWVHHVSVRSAVAHLAQCIQPLLILALALPACFRWSSKGWPRVLAWCLVAGASALVTTQANPLLSQLGPNAQRDLVVHVVHGEELRLPTRLAEYLTALEAVVAERVPPEDTLFQAPAYAGIYALLEKPSPTWWLYFGWPADEGEQLRTIDELERRGAGWALIFNDTFLDNRTDLAFKNSNPLVWQYLKRNFQPVSEPRLPPGNLLLRRK
ncbi:MAG: hypothetical protein HOP15_14390 [Planctomycetes bacterium]|nr:hypothetical protein [Planctomycetota bacterium]